MWCSPSFLTMNTSGLCIIGTAAPMPRAGPQASSSELSNNAHPHLCEVHILAGVPPRAGRGQGAAAGHPSQGPARLAPPDQPGLRPCGHHRSICWTPAPCQAHTLPPLSFVTAGRGDLHSFVQQLGEGGVRSRSHGLQWQDWDPSPRSWPPSHPPVQAPRPATPPGARGLAQWPHWCGHISGAWSWRLASARSKRPSPPWSRNCHHNPAKQQLDSFPFSFFFE